MEKKLKKLEDEFNLVTQQIKELEAKRNFIKGQYAALSELPAKKGKK